MESPPPICSLLPELCCCILSIISVLLCSPSADFSTPCLALGRPFSLLPSSSFLLSFILVVKRLTISSLHFFHHLLLLYFTFFFFFFFSFHFSFQLFFFKVLGSSAAFSPSLSNFPPHLPGAPWPSFATIGWRRHRLNAKLLSTHSNIAFPSSPDISRQRAAINHPCVMIFHKFRDVLRSCLIERNLDVQACQIHWWPYHTAMFQHGSSFFFPFPALMQQNRHHHLQVLATYPIDFSTCNFFQFSSSILFQTQKNTRRVPLRYHRCQRNGPVTYDPFLRFRNRFPQEHQFQNLP